jgi:hypothetical protein
MGIVLFLEHMLQYYQPDLCVVCGGIKYLSIAGLAFLQQSGIYPGHVIAIMARFGQISTD